MSTSDQVQNAASISTAKLATSVKKDTTVKFRSAGQPAGITSKMLGDNRYSPNPAPAASDPFVNFSPSKMHKLEQEDQRSSISDTDDSCSVQLDQTPGKPLPAPGKKTRGRVKIQMEYIQNKLRRYTTFSKRKSGMMKKAYELSTLTGTQVMLLVASETGHVYTFATPKLQPMITSEAGKALIQTCLHQPDPPNVVVPPPGDYDMRMSVNGFEETELGYQMSEEDYKNGMDPNLHIASTATPMPAILNHGPIVTIPHGMMPLHGFAPSSCIPETHPMTSQAMNTIMSHAPMPHVPASQALSPPHHSPPPSYSPPQPASPPHASPYTPTSMPHQPVMIDELNSPSLAHHGHIEAYDRSPSHSPIQHRYSHSPQALYSSAANGGSPSIAGPRI